MKHEQKLSTGSKWEKFGTFLSIACAIECLTLPVIAGMLPVIGIEVLSNHFLEAIVCLGALGLCSFNLARGYRIHGNRNVFALLAMAALLIFTGHFITEHHEKVFTIIGALCLVSAQFVNRRLCSVCHCDHHHHAEIRR